MLNCNIFDTTCLNMSLNITQFNVSAKYDLVILQFNVSKGSDVIVHPDRTQYVAPFKRMCVVNHFLHWLWTERFWRLKPVVSSSFRHHGAEDVPSACSGPRMERRCEAGCCRCTCPMELLPTNQGTFGENRGKHVRKWWSIGVLPSAQPSRQRRWIWEFAATVEKDSSLIQRLWLQSFVVLKTIEVHFSWTKASNKNTKPLIMPGKCLMVLSNVIYVWYFTASKTIQWQILCHGRICRSRMGKKSQTQRIYNVLFHRCKTSYIKSK